MFSSKSQIPSPSNVPAWSAQVTAPTGAIVDVGVVGGRVGVGAVGEVGFRAVGICVVVVAVGVPCATWSKIHQYPPDPQLY